MQIDTGRMPCENKGRDWGMHLQAKVHQKLSENPQKQGKKHRINSFLRTSKGAKHTDTLISDF